MLHINILYMSYICNVCVLHISFNFPLIIIFVSCCSDILRVFNPELTGFSVGTGKQNTKQAFLNQAVAGAKSL